MRALIKQYIFASSALTFIKHTVGPVEIYSTFIIKVDINMICGSHFMTLYTTSGSSGSPYRVRCKYFDVTAYLTAFITFMGIDEFTRVPFGPKNAPSWYQQLMAGVVLSEILYIICEMYVDDCIVYEETEE